MYHVSHRYLKECACGARSKEQNLDANLFAEPVNMDELVRSLDTLMVQSPEYKGLKKEN